MKYLIPALALFLFSCQKDFTVDNTAGSGSGGSGGSGGGTGGSGGGGTGTAVTLGVQKGIFASSKHSFRDILEANDKRLFFVAHNNTTTFDDFYAGDATDSVYLLTPYGDPNSFTSQTAKTALKPNGEIVCILKKANASGPDSIIILVNKPATKNWELVKKELSNSFWDTYYNSFSLFVESTSTGRLVLTGFGNTKVGVSDDNGLTWRQTFTLPPSYANTVAEHRSSFSGTRNFIMTGSLLLYSDDNFETGTLVGIGTFGNIQNKIIKFDDQRLVLQYSTPDRTFYESTNNGQTWSVMPLYDAADTLSDYSRSYFCFVTGNTMRVRAKYKRCDSYYTVDVNPASKFAYYPLTPVPSCPLSTSADDVLMSCQRGDKRIYYASYFYATSTFLIINRDY